MNYEKSLKIEKIGKNREELLALEKEGKYVFHGSPNIIEVIKPHQAGGHSDTTGKWELDGKKPAVFASPYADCAIFRALIYGKEFENSIGIDNDNQLNFTASRELIERAKNRTGRVYVLDKTKFAPATFRGMDYKIEKSITSLKVIEVTYEDLPGNIKIIE